jgi:nucleoside-diphosphate-sugar epimerase
MAARPRNELVLGGEGLIGHELCRALETRGGEVRSLDLKSGQDLRSAHRFRAAFQAADRIWFLAWEVGGWKFLNRADLQHRIYRNNCLLSASIFEELKHCRKPFLYTTSQLAGDASAYGLTKLMAEAWVKETGGVLARLWNVYGWETPGERSHVVPDLVMAALQGEIRSMSDGTEERQFVHVTDCVEGLIRLMESGLPAADITSGEWVPVSRLAREIGHRLEVPVRLGTLPGTVRKVEPTLPLPDWAPRISLADGIGRVIAVAKDQTGDFQCAVRPG